MTLGWDDAWQAARAAVDPGDAVEPVRIAAEHRGAYHAMARDGAIAWVELTGKAFHRAGDKRELPTVGDWVVVERWPEAVAGAGAAVVRAVLPRRTFLVRRAAGGATAPQPLAANVDAGELIAAQLPPILVTHDPSHSKAALALAVLRNHRLSSPVRRSRSA